MSARARVNRDACASCLLAALATTGCFTTTNTARLEPLETKYPVSLSAQYVDEGGRIVDQGGYDKLGSFEFEMEVDGARHDDTSTRIELEQRLDQVLAEQRGDAVTNLRIAATEYDSGSHGSAAGWKTMGWTFGITGGTFLVVGAASDEPTATPFITGGAIFAGVGALSFLFATLADDPAKWHLVVSGDVVRTGAATPTPQEPPPAAEPPAAGEQ